MLSETAYEIENFVLNTLWETAKNNEDIVGAGIFFEPNKFDSAVKEYSIYMNNDQAANNEASSYGSYESYSNEDWYRTPITNKEPYLTDPFEHDGVSISTIAYPIIVDGEALGVVTVVIDMGSFARIKTSDEKYPTMYSTITATDGTFVFDSTNPKTVAEGANLESYNSPENWQKLQENYAKGLSFTMTTSKILEGVEIPIIRFFTPIKTSASTLWVQSALEVSDLNKDSNSLTTWTIIIACIALITILLVTLYVIKRMLKPIAEIEIVAKDMSNGLFDTQLQHISNDELGRLANSMRVLQSGTKMVLDDIGIGLDNIAKSDFTKSSICGNEKCIGIYEPILNSLYNIVVKLTNTMSEISQVSNQVNLGGEQVSNGSQVLSQGATEQAAGKGFAVVADEVRDLAHKSS